MDAQTPLPPAAVLFDLDGTLIDSVPLILDSFRHAFAACGLPVPEEAQLLQGVGTPLAPHFARYSSDPAEVDHLIRTYREHNLANHDTRIRAFAGITTMLQAVHRAGARTAIVTSKNRQTTERGLRVAGLEGLFEAIVPSDEVTKPKPDPEPVLRALALLGIERTRTVFVGDSLHDLHCGRAAGVRTAAVLWGPFGRDALASGAPDYWIETPGDLCRTIGLSGPAL